MKLLRLKINKNFRSLRLNEKGEGFEVHFLRDFDKNKMHDFMPYCLVGRNGSGKSNILEALAVIFYHIECIYHYKPEGFEGEKDENGKVLKNGFFEEHCTPDAFELEYLFPIPISLVNKEIAELNNKTFNDFNAHILIEKRANERLVFKWLNRKEFAHESEAHEVLNRIETKYFLPQYVIGYSSGENEILSLPFFKMRFLQYDEYEDALREETGYTQPEGRMVYLDTQHSQAVFLTNYLMQDAKLLKPIYDAIGVKAITHFRIIIRQGIPIAKYRTEEQTTMLKAEELTIDNKDVFELTYNLKRRPDADIKELKVIDKLKNCATSQFLDTEDQTLYLDYFIDEDIWNEEGNLVELSEMKKAFRGNFDNPFELFRAFQILLTLNLYDVDIEHKQDLYKSGSLYVNETVPVLASDKRLMRFKDFIIEKDTAKDNILSKSLSDGEHQYLHAIGICLLFKNSNSLFLLDEPETHFNPDWRASFISTLRDSLIKDEKGNNYIRELLITSHSPFIVSDCQEENVLVFKKDNKTGLVTVDRPGFNTFGASVNQITVKVFGKNETIGNYSKETLTDLYKRLESGEDKETLIDEAFNKLGESVERIIFVNKASEK